MWELVGLRRAPCAVNSDQTQSSAGQGAGEASEELPGEWLGGFTVLRLESRPASCLPLARDGGPDHQLHLRAERWFFAPGAHCVMVPPPPPATHTLEARVPGQQR